MFITKKRSDELRQEAWKRGYESATSNYEQEFFRAANQLALEATRAGVPSPLRAKAYNEIYNEVYDSLVAKHG